jgi:hypothetical protein
LPENKVLVLPIKPGPIINKIMNRNEYMVLNISCLPNIKKDNVLYCDIDNIYSKESMYVRSIGLHLPIIKVNFAVRYIELESNHQ